MAMFPLSIFPDALFLLSYQDTLLNLMVVESAACLIAEDMQIPLPEAQIAMKNSSEYSKYTFPEDDDALDEINIKNLNFRR